MLGSARIHDVRMAQLVLKIEKLSHIMGPRASQDLRSPSPIMAPGFCDIQNNQGLGKGYQPRSSASAGNPYLDLDYSGYRKNLIQ